MIFLRVLVVALLTGVAVCALAWVFTRERRYLRLAWRLLVGGLFAALVFFAVLFVERLTAEPVAAESAWPGALPDRQSERTAGVAALRMLDDAARPGGPAPS